MTSTLTDRRRPWNVMGNDLDLMGVTNVADALAQAGLDYTISKQEVVTTEGLKADKFRATVRTDKNGDQRVLGVVGTRYTIVQNPDAFAPADVLAAQFGAKFDGAADFRDGSKSLLIMDLGKRVLIGQDDAVDTYVIFGNSHDGSGSLYYAITPVRLRCTNALTATLVGAKDAGRLFRMSHTPNFAAKQAIAVEALSNALNYMDEFSVMANRMADQAITDREFSKIVAGIFPLKDDASDRTMDTVATARAAVTALYHGEANANITGTRWGAYNAVTEYVDWARPVRQGDPVARAEGALDGPYVRVKQRALEAFAV